MTCRRTLALAGALLLAGACSNSGNTSTASLLGAADMIFMDLPPDAGLLADPNADAGLANHYLFITSADTNELRVLDMFRPGVIGRNFVRAPNPLESLSIPVLERPQVLAADEGLGTDGRRVTGSYVYAARLGGEQISVVDGLPSGLNQVTHSPKAVGAPITAMAGWLGNELTQVPATSTLFFATYDGAVAGVWALELPEFGADRAQKIEAAQPRLLLDTLGESIVALKVIPPLDVRTLDGQPFCATVPCLALATRSNGGRSGRTIMVETTTLRSAPLNFPGPVRELSTTGFGLRIFGALDEEKCDSVSCGGVLGVDGTVGTTASGFPLLTDFSGQTMQPLTATSLPRGLALAENSVIKQVQVYDDAGYGEGVQGYGELGLFSTASGPLVVFDAVAGVAVDYDGRRPTFVSAALFIPGQLPDGGYALFTDDGGVNYTATGSAISSGVPQDGTSLSTATLYEFSIVSDGGDIIRRRDDPYTITIADGYFVSQYLRVTYQGQLPGLVSNATSPADGTQVTFPTGYGYENRLEVGDLVVLGETQADGGVEACGKTTVASWDAGVIQLADVPATCEARSSYGVLAAGADPIVLTGSVEGYMGRTSPGGTITYTKRYLTKPQGFSQPQPAFSISLGTLPTTPGAYWEFTLDGHLSPYRIQFDTSLCASGTTIVPGKVLMGQYPYYYNAATTLYYWEYMAMFPAANSVVEARLDQALDFGISSISTSVGGAACWR